MEVQEKKTKEEILQEKKINSSLVILPNNIQLLMNIVSVNMEDSVIYTREGFFLKVYSLSIEKEKRKEFIEYLCKNTFLRIRLTSEYVGKNKEQNEIVFLSVIVEADLYSDAYILFERFEKEICNVIRDKFNLNIALCTLNHLMTFIHHNSYGDISKFDFMEAVQKKDDIYNKLFPVLLETTIGFKNETQNKYGSCYFCKDFISTNVTEVYKDMLDLTWNYKMSIEIDVPDKEDQEVIELFMKKKYNCSNDEPSNNETLNASIVIMLAENTEKESINAAKELKEVFEKHGIILVPCVGNQIQIFKSICGLGISEFNLGRNIYLENIVKLFF